MSKKKPILCLDFDGVIHSYKSGWCGAWTIPDEPVPGAIEFISDQINDGWDVVICSSRARYIGGIWAMRRWLKKYSGNLWYESMVGYGIESVRFTRTKPPAQLTIDDRAITFTGTWPTADRLKNFRPWNKKREGFYARHNSVSPL